MDFSVAIISPFLVSSFEAISPLQLRSLRLARLRSSLDTRNILYGLDDASSGLSARQETKVINSKSVHVDLWI